MADYKGLDYKNVRSRRDIIDRAALTEQLNGLTRDQQKALLTKAYKSGQTAIRKRLEAGKIKGIATANAHAYLMDQIVKLIYFNAQKANEGGQQPPLSIVAVGGYGRGELAPHSDIDIMFLTDTASVEDCRGIVEDILYMLWDLGLKVGHSIRTLADVIKESKSDLTITTSLLDARFICGDQDLFLQSAKQFVEKVVALKPRQFVEGKLAERDARHIRMGDTRYVVEPNIKEGKGGLRDLQTLYWIARYLYGVTNFTQLKDTGVLNAREARQFRRAQDFLWTVRFYLHYFSGRAEERLTFDTQLELAKRLNYRSRPGVSGVERFMKHFFLNAKTVGDLTRVFCAYLEARHQKETELPFKKLRRTKFVEGFILDNNRLSVKDDNMFQKSPINLLTIYQVAEETGYDIHPNALAAVQRALPKIDRSFRRTPEANKAFMAIMTSRNNPELSLRRMNESGVFGRFIPDFGRIVAQTQHDMYHHFTVDEHTIRAIGLLSKIEKDGGESYALAHRLLDRINAREALYVAVLLHDIAKGRRGSHSEIGADIALKLCPRLGLSKGDTELVSWLVRYHLLMSHTAFKRDLADPKTIKDFVDQIKSPERLRLLYILTVVDISAVGPGVWNDWKGQMLEDLYTLGIEALLAGHKRQGRQHLIDDAVNNLKNAKPSVAGEIVAYMQNNLADAYWIAESIDTHVANADLIADALGRATDVAVDFDTDSHAGATRISVFTKDRTGVFNTLSGAMSVLGAEVVDAKIYTMKSGMLLDNFYVRGLNGQAFDDHHKLQSVAKVISSALDGKLDIAAEILARIRETRATKSFPVAPYVVIDNKASNHYTVIEVNALDRLGLLFELTKVFVARDVSVKSAHIATYGERAVDVFYVQNRDGKKITNSNRLNAIKRDLIKNADAHKKKSK